MINKYSIASFVFVVVFILAAPAIGQKKDYNIITFVQDDSSIAITMATDSIVLQKKPFSVQFYNKRYNSEKEQYHAMRVAVLTDAADTLMLGVGKSTAGIPYFEPGTGMATGGNGMYDALMINNQGHHYLFYENEAERRVSRIAVVNDLLQLEWNISGVFMNDNDIALTDFSIPVLYFVFFADRNLNEVIDVDELKIVKVKFR